MTSTMNNKLGGKLPFFLDKEGSLFFARAVRGIRVGCMRSTRSEKLLF